ncbi:uncharacterized protein BX663DRAFT_65437 [Cokeromyces recurvatus]|uniref:uncharacterized protein n=1 Tax=Cokeromyces recurvatus TaxID=90255 RepID=UPI002221141E|nr:uncharacterized protein BX663DRAFT_65437 [Cokeromyces recurvatus]KAI7902659.1 hypothetical protein BX663DRAFT_65437 [Cokeromyces recurvatus]
MDAYANVNDLDNVLSTFKRIESLNLEPDVYTYAIILKAFVENKRLDDAFIVFEYLKENGIILSQPAFSTLISGCIKANKIEKAWEIFDSMRLSYHQPDEVSFTLMLHACTKRGEVEKALNLFEDMIQQQLYPTDVTFNVLINACARRTDYFNEAFNLLDQMKTHYGFQPDRITYNTLIMACARNKDLPKARELFQIMWNDNEEKKTDSLLTPDSCTYTNLFWAYASCNPELHDTQEQKPQHYLTTLPVVQQSILSSPPPRNQSEVVKEAHQLFNYMVASNIPVTSVLLLSYLAIHISHNQPISSCMHIYNNLFDQYQVKKDAFTFKQMLELCYKRKDKQLAWKIWEDYQDFLESRNKLFLVEDESISEKKAIEAEKYAMALKEGWTDKQQLQIAVLMTNTLARSNDLRNAISILSSELRRSNVNPPKFNNLAPTYNKCIQLEDEDAKNSLLKLCIKNTEKRPLSFKYKRVNTIQ